MHTNSQIRYFIELLTNGIKLIKNGNVKVNDMVVDDQNLFTSFCFNKSSYFFLGGTAYG